MTTRRTTDFWKHHIRAWNKSGLSQSEYARRHELPVKTFGYHKRRLDNQRIIQSALNSEEQKPLIPVCVAQEPEPQKTPETGITLVSPGGLRDWLLDVLPVEQKKAHQPLHYQPAA